VLEINNNGELCCARAKVNAQTTRRRYGLPKTTTPRSRFIAVYMWARGSREILSCSPQLPNTHYFNDTIYDGVKDGKPIYLYYNDKYFDVITKSYFCETCKKSYSNKERYVCKNPCVCYNHSHSEEEYMW
jgi:hypothetical protein